MDKQTKSIAIWAVLILIVIAYFTIESNIVLFIGLGALLFLGVAVEGTKTKD